MSKVLYLPMKGKWYDLVLSGEKKEEYRLFKPYWASRIAHWIDDDIKSKAYSHAVLDSGKEWAYISNTGEPTLQICFVNGYSKKARRFMALCDKVTFRTNSLHPEWGEHEYAGLRHIVLRIAKILAEKEQ